MEIQGLIFRPGYWFSYFYPQIFPSFKNCMDLKWFYDIFACPMCTKFITSLKVYANFSIALFFKGGNRPKTIRQSKHKQLRNFLCFSTVRCCSCCQGNWLINCRTTKIVVVLNVGSTNFDVNIFTDHQVVILMYF